MINPSERKNAPAEAELLQNILRILCMLEKELGRVARRSYLNRSQYPDIFLR